MKNASLYKFFSVTGGLFAAMLKIICAKAKDVVILHSANSALSVDETIKAPEKGKKQDKARKGESIEKTLNKHRKNKKKNKKTNQRCQKTETRRESC